MMKSGIFYITGEAFVPVILEEIQKREYNSPYYRGVQRIALKVLTYRDDFPGEVESRNWDKFQKFLLSGAADIEQYCEGGCSYICPWEIFCNFCSESGYNRYMNRYYNGGNVPDMGYLINAHYKAFALIKNAFEKARKRYEVVDV